MSTTDLSISQRLPEEREPGISSDMHAAGVRSLRHGVIETTVAPAIARWMILLFLSGIASLPLLQIGEELLNARRVQALDIATPPAKAAILLTRGEIRHAYHQLKWWLSKRNLSHFEQQLDEASFAKRLVQPYVQYALSSFLSFGNSIAVVTRDGWIPSGWLHYQLSLDYVAGPGLLDPDYLQRREQQLLDDGEPRPNADPRPAIIRFSEDCRRAGVHLVFVPTPVKCMIQPAGLISPFAFSHAMPPLNNPDYPRFIADLRAAGVDVFDPTPDLIMPGERSRYLMQDTHWTPDWMEQVAQRLAQHIEQRTQLPPAAPPRSYRIQPTFVSRVGDIVDALHLPGNQVLFWPQTVTIHRVLDAATDQPAPSNPAADVLLIGDSFSNIYSAPQMGWGDAAGFPHQLMRFLGRDLEILVRNGAAASELRFELAARPHPLRGKRLVIWQVSMHELTNSNWEVIPIPTDSKPAASERWPRL